MTLSRRSQFLRGAAFGLALGLVFTGCSSDNSNDTSQDSADASPEPTKPAWLNLGAGNRVLLTGMATDSDPSMFPTVTTCEDAYTYGKYSENNESSGCTDRPVGQIVTIKQYDGNNDVVIVHGSNWSAVLDKEDLEPLVPAETIMQCQDASDSLTLYSLKAINDGFDLRDGLETVQVTHTRRANETFGIAVKVLKGYGAGRPGYIKGSDLASCFLPNGNIQINLTDD